MRRGGTPKDENPGWNQYFRSSLGGYWVVLAGRAAGQLETKVRFLVESQAQKEGEGQLGRLARTIMFQGTASNVGKSILSTALCRILKQDGYRVAPFKAQNMALNSYVTRDGGEIGRSQGIQAEAAGCPAAVEMNPILLKPKQDAVAQVIVKGRPLADMSAGEYRADYLPRALETVRECLDKLRREFDVVVLEGAGSPAEINLKDRDIVNMKAAELAEAPVILVADIDRGGAFASLVGTLELLDPDEKEMVAGFIFNRFRGEVALLEPGLRFLEEKTGKPVLGVVPYLYDLGIDAEDSVSLTEDSEESQVHVAAGREESTCPGREIDIAVIQLPRISNFTDFDPLRVVPGVGVRFVKNLRQLGNPDAVILPGTKNTTGDLIFLQESGLADRILDLAGQGKMVVGICGGFQMLGTRLVDPHETQSGVREMEGLGLLDIETTFSPEKVTHQVQAKVASRRAWWRNLTGVYVRGYEIHMGNSVLGCGVEPAFQVQARSGKQVHVDDGAVSADGRVFGTYLHGLFDNAVFLREWLKVLSGRRGHRFSLSTPGAWLDYQERREAAYDRLADHVRQHVNLHSLYRIMGLVEKR